jgi:ribose transport system permease protein
MSESAARTQPIGLKASFASLPGVLLIMVLLILSFAAVRPAFLSGANIINIGLQSAILLIIALPQTMIILSEGIDISMGSVLSLCGVALAMVLVSGGPVYLAFLASLGVALAFGIFNGALVCFVGMPAFVVTLGSFGMAQGIAEVLTDGNVVVGLPSGFEAFYAARPLGVPVPILVAAAAYLSAHFILYRTRFGTYVFAIGGNREALVLSGVRAAWYHLGIYALGGVFIAVASLLLTARMNSGHPTVAIGMEFDAIAAVVLGGTSFERGEGWLLGTLLGVLAIGILRNGLDLLMVPSSLQGVSVGILVIATMLIDRRGVRAR